MQNQSWMQPAVQAGEAVLLPALERKSNARPRMANRRLPLSQAEDTFMPADTTWEDTQPAHAHHPASLHGSMAGRSVLRAAGVRTTPVTKRCRRCR